MVGLLAALFAPLTGVLVKLQTLGAVGKVGYFAGLALWTLCCLPTTPIELAAGYIFPLVSSASMSAVGKTVGNLFALMLGRRLLKPIIQRWLSKTSSSSSALHKHLLHELRENPIQTSACAASNARASVQLLPFKPACPSRRDAHRASPSRHAPLTRPSASVPRRPQ